MELMMNTDCRIPEGTHRSKHGKFGVEFPLDKLCKYQLYRKGILLPIKRMPCENNPHGRFDKLYCMPGDLLMNLTEDWVTFFAIEFIKEDGK